MAGVKVSQADFISRWKNGVGAGGSRYSSGIQNSGDWAGAYVAAEPVMMQNLQAALAAGKHTRAVQALGTQGWRNATMAKGPTAWINGVNNSQKIQAGVSKLYNMLDTSIASLNSVPRGTYEQNKLRATTFMDAMHNAKLNS